jgi:hypothetical protein
MKQQVPRKDEPMKVWIGKAAKFYRVDYTTLENLYYRPNRSIPNDVYLKLTSLRTPSFNPEAIIQANKRDLEDLKEFKKQIRKEILNELVGTFQKLVEADAR